MADIKWSSFPTVTIPTAGDILVGLRSGGNVQFTAPKMQGLTTWTPVFSFQTVGDLSVSYQYQYGYYSVMNNIVVANFVIWFTPTFSTSSGLAMISGLPIAPNDVLFNVATGTLSAAGITFPTSCTYVHSYMGPTSSNILFYGSGSGLVVGSIPATNLQTNNFTSGTVTQLFGTLTYQS